MQCILCASTVRYEHYGSWQPGFGRLQAHNPPYVYHENLLMYVLAMLELRENTWRISINPAAQEYGCYFATETMGTRRVC